MFITYAHPQTFSDSVFTKVGLNYENNILFNHIANDAQLYESIYNAVKLCRYDICYNSCNINSLLLISLSSQLLAYGTILHNFLFTGLLSNMQALWVNYIASYVIQQALPVFAIMIYGIWGHFWPTDHCSPTFKWHCLFLKLLLNVYNILESMSRREQDQIYLNLVAPLANTCL